MTMDRFPFTLIFSSANIYIGLNYMSNTAGALLEAGDAYPLRAHRVTPGFWWDPCCVFSFVLYCVHTLSCLPIYLQVNVLYRQPISRLLYDKR